MDKSIKVLVISVFLILALSVSAQQERSQEDADQEEPIVYTNADLPPAPATSGSLPTAATPTTAPPTTALPPLPSGTEVRDRNGHGEGWWRLRAAELDVRVLDARYTAEQLHVDYVKGKTLTDPTLPVRSKEATRVLQELEAERDRLPEELRKAGGMPGWLRRGDAALPSELLPAPVTAAPIHTEGITFSWQTVQGAAFYIVEVQCSDCCGPMGDCDVESLDVSGTSAQFPFEAARSGRWRVRALDASGFPGDWSAWDSFVHTAR